MIGSPRVGDLYSKSNNYDVACFASEDWPYKNRGRVDMYLMWRYALNCQERYRI